MVQATEWTRTLDPFSLPRACSSVFASWIFFLRTRSAFGGEPQAGAQLEGEELAAYERWLRDERLAGQPYAHFHEQVVDSLSLLRLRHLSFVMLQRKRYVLLDSQRIVKCSMVMSLAVLSTPVPGGRTTYQDSLDRIEPLASIHVRSRDPGFTANRRSPLLIVPG